MNKIMQKWMGNKGGVLLILLLVCAAALLLFPALDGGGGSAMTGEERRISAALSRIEGAGQTQVAIHYAYQESALNSGKSVPGGVIIVSEGAHDMGVRLDLMRAAQTLLDLPAGSVEVFAAEEGK